METIAADRGGPFGRNGAEARNYEARNWMRASAPGIAFRCRPAESSPIGSDAQRLRPRGTARKRGLLIACVVIACLGAASVGNGLYIYAKARVAQVLLHSAWAKTQASGTAVKPWPWADTHPVARLRAPAQDADLLVLAGPRGARWRSGPGIWTAPPRREIRATR